MSTTMANISAAQVKELRDKTGAPMMDCKHGFDGSEGHPGGCDCAATEEGRVGCTAKKATRVTSEGSVGHLHPRGREDWCAG